MENKLKERILLGEDIVISLEKLIKKVKNKLQSDKLELQGLCDHEYVKEIEPYSHTIYYCKKCGKEK